MRRIYFLALIICFCVGIQAHAEKPVLLRSGPPVTLENAVYSPDGKWIALTDHDGMIRVMRSDGTDLHGVTPFDLVGYGTKMMSWSPNSQDILYSPAGNGELYIANVNGTQKLQLTDEFDYFSAAWSPDGTRVLYVGSQGLYVANRDGTRMRDVLKGNFEPRIDYHPAWLPDGTHVVVWLGLRVLLINVDDESITPIALPDSQHTPLLAPRGSLVAYGTHQTNGRYPFAIFDVFNPSKPLYLFDHKVAWFAWSPNGQQAVFTTLDEDVSELSLFDAATAQTRALIGVPVSDLSLTKWSPDGTRISLTTGAWPDLDYYAMKIDGSDVHQVPLGLGENIYSTTLHGWSPDSQAFLISAAFNDYSKELVEIDVTTQATQVLGKWCPGPDNFDPCPA